MKRAHKVVLAQPAAAAAPPPRPLPRAPRPVRGDGGEAFRASQRYQSLLQDYKELLKETAAKKNRLHLEKLKKQRLSAEVKFLRRRYKSMSENPSQTAVYRLKNPAMTPTSRTAVWVDHHGPVQAVGSSSKVHLPAQQQRQHLVPRASPVIDLNEACELSSSEETEEFHGYQETVRVDKVNRYLLEGNVVAGPSDSKMPTFWDARNPAATRAGKRKISWQDQLALRV
ncbi:hypothetical protein CFC21_087791 [Triticum aestivum]|uniref:Uncharacterized protein n=2 Tax=Triticum aestivum TaxID=4565 RepID=A0A9R1II47_WHEAT|nr:uncharacterized protein LOC123136705 [Triticum aestivum]KAF7084105.1 hypothetical protein CFC21_087791 [Triticum aestivum]